MLEISSILLFLCGLFLVAVCSDMLVDGASDIARRSGISEFVIGLTIVGIGTSLPEMVVSFLSAMRGNADMAVGNIIGSNIFNTFLILGITALILPMEIKRETIRKDIPINIAATLLLIFVGFSKTIFGIGQDMLGRPCGAIMLIGFAIYLFLSFKEGGNSKQEEGEESATKVYKNVAVPILMTIGGLAGLIIGGRMFVDGATEIAQSLGWSDKFIAITILAGGTSLPELATCIVAALKRKGQLALGNIIGSNISNILLILGGSALIHPLSMANITFIDSGALLISTLVVFFSYFLGKHKLGRIGGILFLIMEAAYMYRLIIEL